MWPGKYVFSSIVLKSSKFSGNQQSPMIDNCRLFMFVFLEELRIWERLSHDKIALRRSAIGRLTNIYAVFELYRWKSSVPSAMFQCTTTIQYETHGQYRFQRASEYFYNHTRRHRKKIHFAVKTIFIWLPISIRVDRLVIHVYRKAFVLASGRQKSA